MAGLVVLPLRRGKGKQVAMMGCEWLGERSPKTMQKKLDESSILGNFVLANK